jgi:hypothetical protein
MIERRITMQRFARGAVTVAGILIFGSALTVVPRNSASAGANASNVNVVNTPSVNVANSALPVSGTVAATQSGPWNVGITGTPSVNIGTPTLQLAGGTTVGVTTSLRDSNGNLIPLLTEQSHGGFSVGTDFTFPLGIETTTAPVFTPGGSVSELIIVEYVGVDITAFTPDQQIKATLLVTACPGCSAVPFPIVLTSQPFGSTTEFRSSQPVRFFLFPGGNISIKADRTILTENTAIAVSFSGDAVRVPL